MYFSNISNKNQLFSRSTLFNSSMTSELNKKFSFDIYNNKSNYIPSDYINNLSTDIDPINSLINESSLQSRLSGNTNQYSIPPSRKLLNSSFSLPLENRAPYLGGISSNLYNSLTQSNLGNIDTSNITLTPSNYSYVKSNVDSIDTSNIGFNNSSKYSFIKSDTSSIDTSGITFNTPSKPHSSSINEAIRSNISGSSLVIPSSTYLDPVSRNQAYRDILKPQSGYIDSTTKGFNQHFRDLTKPKYVALREESIREYVDTVKPQNGYMEDVSEDIHLRYKDNSKRGISSINNKDFLEYLPSEDINFRSANNLEGVKEYNQLNFKSKTKTSVSSLAKKVELTQAGLDNYQRVIQLVFDFENRSTEGVRLPQLASMREKRYEMLGAGALYDPRKNVVAVDDSIIGQLNRGKLTKDSFGTLAHELAHSYQNHFGNTWKKQRAFENRVYSPDIDEVKPGNLIQDKYTKRVVKRSLESIALTKQNMPEGLTKERRESAIRRSTANELDAYSLEDRITRSVDVDRIFDPDYKLTKVGYRTEDTIRKVRATREFNKKLLTGSIGALGILALSASIASSIETPEGDIVDIRERRTEQLLQQHDLTVSDRSYLRMLGPYSDEERSKRVSNLINASEKQEILRQRNAPPIEFTEQEKEIILLKRRIDEEETEYVDEKDYQNQLDFYRRYEQERNPGKKEQMMEDRVKQSITGRPRPIGWKNLVDFLDEPLDQRVETKVASGSQQYVQRQEALARGELYTDEGASIFIGKWTSEPMTNRSNEDWKSLLKKESDFVRSLNRDDQINILLGDSLTQWFRPYQLPEKEDTTWLNQGISGQNIQQIDQRIDILKSMKGDKVFIMAGINDLRQGRSDKEILERYSSMLDNVKKSDVADEVVVQSILPTRLDNLPTNRIKSLNSQIKAMAEKRGMTYIDLLPHFLNEEGRLKKEYTTDGIHLSRKGYDTWSKLMSQHLNGKGEEQNINILGNQEKLERNTNKAGESIIPPSSSLARQAAKNNKDKEETLSSSAGGGGSKPPGTPRASTPSPPEEPDPRKKAGLYTNMDDEEKKSWVDRLKSAVGFMRDEKLEDIVKGVGLTAGLLGTIGGVGLLFSNANRIFSSLRSYMGLSTPSSSPPGQPITPSQPTSPTRAPSQSITPPQPRGPAPSSSVGSNLPNRSISSGPPSSPLSSTPPVRTRGKGGMGFMLGAGLVSLGVMGVIGGIAGYMVFSPGEDRTSGERRDDFYSSPEVEQSRKEREVRERQLIEQEKRITGRPDRSIDRDTSLLLRNSRENRDGSSVRRQLSYREYMALQTGRSEEHSLQPEISRPSSLSLDEHLAIQSQGQIRRRVSRDIDQSRGIRASDLSFEEFLEIQSERPEIERRRERINREDSRSRTLSLGEYLSMGEERRVSIGGDDNRSRARYLAIMSSPSQNIKEGEGPNFLSGIETGPRIITTEREIESNYGVTTVSSLEKFLRGSDPGSVKGTQFLLEARPFNNFSNKRLEFLNPVFTKIFKSEVSLLSEYQAEIVLDTTEFVGSLGRKEKARSFIKEKHPGINLILYNGLHTPLPGQDEDQGRLFHSKMYLLTRDGKMTARIDTAGYSNFTLFGLGLDKIDRLKDFYYETTDKETVRGLAAYYEDVKAGKVTDKRYSDTIISSGEIIRTLMQDIESSTSQVIINAATIEYSRKKTTSEEDRIQSDLSKRLINQLAYRGEKNLPTMVSSKDFDSSIINQLSSSGVAIGTPPKKLHYNVFYVEDINETEEDILYLTTRRISSSSNEEIAIRLSSLTDPEAVKFFLETMKQDIGFEEALQNLSISKSLKQLGTNTLFHGLYRGSDKAGTLLLDPNMGASYFYGRALYNNQQRQARAHHRVIDQETSGVATAMYKAAYLAKLNEGELIPQHSDLDRIPGIVQQYDRELYTPGIGAILNEKVFMRLGLGRLYKDELGFLPSAMGALGSVLDKTYLYLNPNANFPGITHYFKEMDIKDSSYRDRPAPVGLFEAGLSELAFLGQASAQGILFYMIIGEPLSMFLSETIKNDVETIISKSLSTDLNQFYSTSSRLQRRGNLSTASAFKSPLSARMEVLSTIDNLRNIDAEYFGAENPGLSIYHFSSIYLRGRSGVLLNEVMKPFLMEIVNPYDPMDVQSNRGFSNVIDRFIEEVRRPVGLAAITPSDPHLDLIKITRTDVQRGLYKQGFSRNQVQSMKIDEIIGYKYARQQFVNKARDFLDTSTFRSSLISNRVNSFKTLIDRFGNYQDFNTKQLANLFGQLEIIENSIDPTDVDVIEDIHMIRRRLMQIGAQIEDPAKILSRDRKADISLTKEGRLIGDIEFEITNEGIDRSSSIAKRLQDILDEIPLNPLNWRMFNKYRAIRGITGQDLESEGYLRITTTGKQDTGRVIPRVRTVGELFSFSDLTQVMREILFGRGGFSQHLARAEVFSDRERLIRLNRVSQVSNFEELTFKDASSIWFDRKIGYAGKMAVDKIHTVWNATIGFAYESSKRVIDKYRYLQGSLLAPFGIGREKGLLRGSRALKDMEYYLMNMQDETTGLKAISWGDDLDEIKEAIKSLEQEAIEEFRGLSNTERLTKYGSLNESEYIDRYVSENIQKATSSIDPTARRLNWLDENVVKSLAEAEQVRSRFMNNPERPFDFIEIQERLRAETLGLFRMGTVKDEALKNRMVRMSPGLGRDVTGKMTKGTLTTTALSISVLSSLILSDLFQSTSGVSLFTQLGFSLFSGGGPIGRLMGNEQGELGINTHFEGDRLFPDIPGLGRVGTTLLTTAGTLYAAHIIGTSALRAEAINYSFTTDFMFQQLKSETGTDIVLSAARGSNEADISLRQKVLSGEIKKGRELSDFIDNNPTRTISMRMKYKDTFEASLSLMKRGDMLNIRSMRFRGNTWLNTMIAYAGLSIGGKALVSSTSSLLNHMRESQGSLDPLAFGVAGALIGSKMTKSFGGGLAGLLIGGLGSYAMNKMGIKVFNLGDPGSVVDNQGATLLGELSDFRNSVMANFDKSSRIELMAALVSQGIESPYGLFKEEASGTDVKVVAKQVTSPIIQFFMAKKTKGQYTDYSGKVVDPGITTYSLGIQGPPITGMSVGIQLPFKILKDRPENNSSGYMNRGSRHFNLVYNDETDILDYLYGIGMIATSAQMLSYSLRTIGAISSPLTPSASRTLGQYRETADNLFTESGKRIGRFGRAVEDVGMVLPNTIHRVAQYISTSDYTEIKMLRRTKMSNNIGNGNLTSVRSFNRSRTLIRYSAKAAFGASILSLGAGLVQEDDKFQENSLVINMTGVGLGIAGGVAQDYLNVASRPMRIAHADKIGGMTRLRKNLLPYALSALVGFHLTDDRFGVFTGMSNEYVKQQKHDEYYSYHREAVIGTYAVAMGTLGATFGRMGMDSGQVLEEYSRALNSLNELEDIQQANTAGGGVLRRVRRAYQAHRVEELEREAQHIVDYFRHRSKQIQETFDLISSAYLDVDPETLREFHLNKARQVIEDTGSMSARDIMNRQDEATALIQHVNRSRGAYIDARLSSRRFSGRLMKGMIGVPIATHIIGSLLHSINPEVFNANKFYDWLESRGTHFDANAPFMKTRNVIADTIRAITFTDRSIDSGISLDRTFRSAAASGGFYQPVSHEKLLIRQTGYARSMTKLFRDLSEIAILDDVNPFISGPLGAGASVRRGDRGTVLTPYIQIQTSGSDISTASYSMSSRFFFRNVLQGNNDLVFEIQNAMRMKNEFMKKGLDPSVVMRRTALNILMATSSLQPRKKPRRASRLSDSQLSSLASDTLLMASLKERMAIQKHSNYQPVESIVTQMLIEQMMPTHKYLDNMLMNVLSPENAKKLGIGVGKNLAAYMMGDPYYLLSRKINMMGIKFFGDQPGGVRGRDISSQARDFPDLFGEYSSKHLETYTMENSKRSPFLESLSDNSSRIFGALPVPVSLMLSLTLGLSITSRLIDFANVIKGGHEISEGQKMLREISSERWFTNAPESDRLRNVWVTMNYPQIGSSEPLVAGAKTLPILSKGSFHFLLNPASHDSHRVSQSLRTGLSEVQKQLDEARLNFRGQSVNIFEYLQINKIKELEAILGGVPNQSHIQAMTVYDNSGNRVYGIDTNKAWMDNLNDARDLLMTSSKGMEPETARRMKAVISAMETEIKSRHITNLSDTILDQVTEHFTKEIDHYIDQYVDSLMNNKVQISRNDYRSMLEKANISDIENRLDKYFPSAPGGGPIKSTVDVPVAAFFIPNASPEEILGVKTEQDLYKLIEARGEATGQLDAISTTDSSGVRVADMRTKLKSAAANSIREEVARELKLFSNDPKKLSRLSSGITGSIKHIASSVTNKIFLNALGGRTGEVEKSFFSVLRHHWGGLGVTPSADTKRSLINNLRSFMSKMTKGSAPYIAEDEIEVAKFHSSVSVERAKRKALSSVELPEEMAELEARKAAGDLTALDIARKTEEINLRKAPLLIKASRGLQSFWDVATSIFDIIEAIDIFSSFSRLSSASRSNMTRAQKKLIASEVGTTINNFTQGMAFMVAMNTINMGIQASASAIGWKALAPILLIAGVIAVVGGVTYMKDQENRESWSGFWKGVSEFWGDTIFNYTEKAEKWGGGGRKTDAILMGTGGALGGLALSASALSMAPGTLMGVFGGVSLLAAGQFLLAGLAIGAGLGVAAALIAPEATSNLFDNLVNSLSDITIGGFPIFGMFLTKPGSGLYMKGYSEPSLGVSRTTPFMVGGVEQVIAADYRRYLLAAKDITGGDAAGLFLSTTIYGSLPTRGNDVVSRYGKTMSIRPGGVVDPVIRREIQLRGQHFNQSVIGRQMWVAMLSNATNYRAIKQADYRDSIRSATLSMEAMKEDNSPEVESKNLKYKNKLRKTNPEIRGEIIGQYVDDVGKAIDRAEKQKEEPLLLSFDKESLDNTNVLSKDYIVNGLDRKSTNSNIPVVSSTTQGHIVSKVPNPEGSLNDTILVSPYSEYDNV